MDRETVEEFARRYKKTQKKISIGVMIFILLLGLTFIGVGLFIGLYEPTLTKEIIGGIMCVAGILNVILAIKFNSFSQKHLKELPAREAARRYSRITGKKEIKKDDSISS